MTDANRRLLVIDDNLADYLIMEYAINLVSPNYHITWLQDGTIAYDYIKSFTTASEANAPKPPLIILLDINLPGVNGKEILKLIKSQDQTKSIPVIMVSHSQVMKEIESLTECGADQFLHKEIDLKIFSDKIQKILEKY